MSGTKASGLIKRGWEKAKANKKRIGGGAAVIGVAGATGYYAHRKRKQRREAEAAALNQPLV